jgi:tRNA pseudouridine38-40 synthase
MSHNPEAFCIFTVQSKEMDHQRYFIRLSYDGTRYHGWQRQPNGESVQQTLEDAILLILRADVKLTGAGRTDTGVHAPEFYAHFDLHEVLTEERIHKLIFKLNSYLPYDIAIREIFPVMPRVHARFSALERTYKYYITPVKNPFRVPYTWYYHGALDMALMNEGARLIMDADDFTSFSKADTDTRTNLCRITHAQWDCEGGELVFTITANRFLRNMVRAIVGTLVNLGRHKTGLEDISRIIESKNRSDAGDSVPGCGLHLVEIRYPDGVLTGFQGGD